ncbi:nickel/cobalt transporter regulator [Zymomonas mobilis]|uniref:Nickel/cobalt transporter regulator n=2 Tax=Zymomonas mobilis TaxID=542 RepID=A0A542W079_ZYMMB|nr:nickel/cobalt transporter regulator [Zymomonas mobilis]
MKIPLHTIRSILATLIVGGFTCPVYAQGGYSGDFSQDPVVRSVDRGSPYIIPPRSSDGQRSGNYGTDYNRVDQGYQNNGDRGNQGYARQQRRFRRGERLPPQWHSYSQGLSDWSDYGLPAPGNNQQWIRYYQDIFLIDSVGNILAVAGQNNGPAAYYDGYYGNNGYVGGNYYAPPVGYPDYYNYGGAYQPAPPPPPPPPSTVGKRQYKQPEGEAVSPMTEDDAGGWRSDPPRQGGVSYDEREEYQPQ